MVDHSELERALLWYTINGAIYLGHNQSFNGYNLYRDIIATVTEFPAVPAVLESDLRPR